MAQAGCGTKKSTGNEVPSEPNANSSVADHTIGYTPGSRSARGRCGGGGSSGGSWRTAGSGRRSWSWSRRRRAAARGGGPRCIRARAPRRCPRSRTRRPRSARTPAARLGGVRAGRPPRPGHPVDDPPPPRWREDQRRTVPRRGYSRLNYSGSAVKKSSIVNSSADTVSVSVLATIPLRLIDRATISTSSCSGVAAAAITVMSSSRDHRSG